MNILVLNGPNLNLLGIREKQIYGTQTYQDLINQIQTYCEKENMQVEIFQTNHEGGLVDRIQQAYFDKTDAIVINPAAYTHTSIAILDALKAVCLPAVEVHLSAVEQREDFRKISYAGMACEKTITGKGFAGYLEAIAYLKQKYDR